MAEFVTVARATDLPEGAIMYVEAGGVPIALCRVEGQIYAVGNLCTHDNGPLSGGSLDGHAIECPRHGARFDVRDGRVKALPAAVSIPTYEVKVEGDEVKVKVKLQ
ncbi:MAG: non-heme iron oxygenase ferredoxin subunit [Candidatus Omnitrophica bacterium]|nr:non-heme iron oxygenase ferredoxin subunit [Candidatus Omnitrophota bacterium]